VTVLFVYTVDTLDRY